MKTSCMCVCAPAGHHAGICQATAEPGLLVSLPRRRNPNGELLPACRPCYEASRRAAWRGEAIFVQALPRVSAPVAASAR
ncbi:MAG TPA: DUF6372 family protein [Pseudonocardiaceae bacterium]